LSIQDGPGLGGGDLDALGKCGTGLADIGIELIGTEIAAFDHLIAHNHAVDHGAVLQRGAQAEFHLGLVLDHVRPDPDSQRHRHAMAARDFRHLVHAPATV
jgi:hypothetical protein